MMTMNSSKKVMTAAQQATYLKRKMGYVTFERPPKYWLKTGSRKLNSVLGSEDKGVPFGKILTLAGMQSSGKTLMAMRLLAKGQKQGAIAGIVDLENSFDPVIASQQGVELGEELEDGSFEKVRIFKPELVKTKDGDARQQTAEELFELVEKWLILQREMGMEKIILYVDSITSVEAKEELEAGFMDQNMRTRLANASFLNRMTKHFMALASNTNTLMIFISQLRTNPTKMFGDKNYVPGGNGVLFYPSSICYMTRGKVIRKGADVLGLTSLIKNKKNKMGGGSREGLECGVEMYYNDAEEWNFIEASEVFPKKKAKK